MDRDLTPDEAKERWEALRQSILGLGKAMSEVLTPVFWQVMYVIRAFIVQLQRVQLCADLMCRWWIPDWLACWLSDKWPERWLPELRFSD